jgi:hypothetical protein
MSPNFKGFLKDCFIVFIILGSIDLLVYVFSDTPQVTIWWVFAGFLGGVIARSLD